MSNSGHSKRRKKTRPELLCEPSVEDEQLAVKVAVAVEVEVIKQKLEQQQQAANAGSPLHEQDFQAHQLADCGTGDNFSNQEASGQMSASADNKHVISSGGCERNRRRGFGQARDRNNSDKQLTNLLAFLFGLLALAVAGANAANSTTLATTTDSSLFNSLSASTSGATPEADNRSSSSSGGTIAPTPEELNEETSTETVTATTPSATSTSPTQEVASSTNSLNEPALETGEDDYEETAAPTGGRLSSGLIKEVAGELADTVLAHLKPREPLAAAAEEEAEPAGVERRATMTQAPPEPETVTETEAEEELRLAMDTYAKWRSTGDELIELFSRKLMPVIMEHGYDVDAVTVTGLLQVFNGIRSLKPWALKLLDASAKLSPGVLVGTQSDFGDYDECLSVRVDDPSGLRDPSQAQEVDESTGLPSSTLVGRYCLADIEFPKPPRVRLAQRNAELNTSFAPIQLRRTLLNFSQTAAYKDTIFVETGNFFHMLYVDPLRLGICLTNKIDPESFSQVLNKVLDEFKVSINFRGRCVTKYDRVEWSRQQVVSAYVLMVACGLVLLCTLLDVLHTKLNKLPAPSSCQATKLRLQASMQHYRPLFTSFSIIRNTKRLFRPQTSSVSPGVQDPAQATYHHSTSGTSSNYSNSSESSPSIERRSSAGDSALHLISDASIISSVAEPTSGQKHSILNQFTRKSSSASSSVSSAASDVQMHQQQAQQRQANLLCLHGIRVITMTWMIVNHTYLFGGFFVLWAYRRLIDISEWPKSFSFQLVLNGWLTVETYFFLGATIIVLNVMPALRARKFTYASYILHRLLRLLPAYTGLICLNFLWPLASSGPVWLVKGRSFIQTPCENYLWTNYLFINNWIWPEKQCMVHTWFLSADFQLYLLAPILVYLLYRRPTFGHTVNIIVAIVASIVSGFVIYANKLMPSTLINKLEFDSIKQQLSYSYFATYQHVGPYCLGIFTGYLLHKRPHVQLPKYLTWSLWLLLPPLSFTTLFLTYLWNGAYDDESLINPSPLVSAFYVAIHRTIWTSLVAWLVFACATGRAKLLASFLSHPMFIPISRLSFSIYLVHLPVIMFRALNLRHTIEWTDANILWEACGNFIVSLIMGYFVNVVFESPITNLEQVIFGRGLREVRHQVELHLDEALAKRGLQQSPKLRPQSKRGSSEDNDSDDNKSADTSELAPTKTASLASGDEQAQARLGSQARRESASQILERHMRWPEASVGRGSSRMMVHKKLVDAYPPVNYHLEEEEEFERGQAEEPMAQPPAPFAKPTRRFPIGETIYQMGPGEYQRFAASRQQASAGGLGRSAQYATLARTSRFERPQDLERFPQVRASRSQLGGSVARQAIASQAQVMSTRRQGRYNTLTGTGTREWRRDSRDDKWLLRFGELDFARASATNSWLAQTEPPQPPQPPPLMMIPRIDSTTLRGTASSLHRNEAPRSIVEEEHD